MLCKLNMIAICNECYNAINCYVINCAKNTKIIYGQTQFTLNAFPPFLSKIMVDFATATTWPHF